ncbi:MAG TPA: helix-turn-helix domain-containing protein [Gemmatimonadales bacterium]|nr:helix-turn-helix domain-containing protein [Gemmatimonadales bacterium]
MTPRRYRLGRRQAAVDRTRARILAAARALLVGPHETAFTIEAVARRARVTRATLYHQFGSRATLLEALFDDLAARGGMWDLADAFGQRDPEEALARYIATFARFWAVHRALHRRLRALAALDAELDRALQTRQEWRRHGLSVLVKRFPERPGARIADPGETVDVLFVLTAFETFDALAGPGRKPSDVARIVLWLARASLGLKRPV